MNPESNSNPTPAVAPPSSTESFFSKQFFQRIADVKVGAVLAVVILYVLFRSYFESFANHYVVEPLLKSCSSNRFNDVVVILSTIFLAVVSVRKLLRPYYATPARTVIALALTSLYLYYRYTEDLWVFTPFSFNGNLKYLDPLFAILILFHAVGLVVTFSKKKSPSRDSAMSFATDSSLGKDGTDLLGREEYAKLVATRIINSSNDKSFAVGVVGPWGSGKTSFLDLIHKHIPADRRRITMEFNPWHSSSSENLIHDFFDAFSNRLFLRDGATANLIKDYARKLTESESTGLAALLQKMLALGTKAETLESQYERIDTVLKELRYQIIIFIDDIDRLDKKEVIEVVRLIRNTANFSNTIFVAAYDRDYVSTAVRAYNKHNYHYFLEKIFQMEIALPPFETDTLRSRLLELLKKRIDPQHHEEIDQAFTKQLWENGTLAEDVILTMRDVSRFVNSFLLSYELLKGEIVFRELVNIELLKLKYPGIYELIYHQRDKFLTAQPSASDKTMIYVLSTMSDKNITDDVQKLFYIDWYLNERPNKHGVPKGDSWKVIQILNSIFWNDTVGIDRSGGVSATSIRRPSHFYKYFTLRIFSSTLSEVLFSKYRSQSQEIFNAEITKWVKGGLRGQLNTRFDRIKDFDSKEDFEKVIRAIIHLAKVPYQDDPKKHVFLYNPDELITKISDRETNPISNKYYEGDKSKLREFLRSVLNIKEPNPVEAELCYKIVDRFIYDSDFTLDLEEIDQFRIGYLRKHLSKIHTFHEFNWTYYHCAKSIKWNGSTKQEEYNADANDLVIDFLNKKDLDGFLDRIRDFDSFNSNRIRISDAAKYIFSSFPKFGEFLRTLSGKKSNIYLEFMEFYELCESNRFQYVSFEFKTLPKRKPGE